MHVDIDWRNVKGYLKICDWVGLKTVNQSAEFFKKLYLFKELYLKKNEVNQPDILYVDRDSGKFNCDFKEFGKVGS